MRRWLMLLAVVASPARADLQTVCSGQPPFRGSGSVRYARESLDGELELKADDFVTRSRVSGRRLGGC